MRLDDSNKISFDYIFAYTLAIMCRINLNDEYPKPKCNRYFKTEEVLFTYSPVFIPALLFN